MGMEAVLVQITDDQLQEFQQNPRLAYKYVTGDPGEGDELERMEAIARATFDRMKIPEHMREVMREAVEKQLQGMTAHKMKGPELIRPKPAPEAEKLQFSLHKDWHVLHYALNGTAEGGNGPLRFAVFGDQEFSGMDGVDYGPARYLTPEQVKGVSAALQQVDPSSLLSKLSYEDARKKRIYLDHTLDDLSNWSYLPEFFVEFRNFYSDAAERGNGMIMKIV